MAQDATTVTYVSPTPPTNISSIGGSPPTPGATDPDDALAGEPGVLTALAAAVSGNEPEGAGTEVVVTAPGSRAVAPTEAVSVLGSWTGQPNQDHASSLTPPPA